MIKQIRKKIKDIPFLLQFLRLGREIIGPRGLILNYAYFHICASVRIIRAIFESGFMAPVKKLKREKNEYRCFIIATGPSLKIEDLLILKQHGETTFGLNSLYKLYSRTEWRPNYYVLIDRELFNEVYDANGFGFIDGLAEIATIVDYQNRARVDQKRTICLPYNKLSHETRFFPLHFMYSENLLWGIYDAYTVTNAAINLAMSMGFKEIYLIGVDGYTGPTRYASGLESKTGESKSLNYFSDTAKKMGYGYEFMKNIAVEKGVKIYNASRGGQLEVFERKDFDSLW